jgi:hypothetical protein
MRRTLFALIAVSLASAPAFAGGAKSGKDAGDEMVCKRQAKTGTRFASKVCHTRSQWAEITEANKRAAAEDFNKPTVNVGKGN